MQWNSTRPWNWPTNASRKGRPAAIISSLPNLMAASSAMPATARSPLTVGSYDLYWIAVDKSTQGMGLGRKIMDRVAEIIRGEGGRNIYIETSTKPHYQATRTFYERCGCPLVATLDDFYAPGDGKAIYCKRV